MREIKFLTFFSIILFFDCFISSSSYSTFLPHNPAIPAFTTPETPNFSSSDADTCSYTCPTNEGSQPAILKYVENEMYRYKIHGFTSLHLPNNLKGENVKLKYSANFDIIAESKCSFLLRVLDVEITGTDGKNYFDNSLHGYAAKFSWKNGRLENLCVDKRESIAATNFKRSIISNIQVSSWGNPITKSMDDVSLFETDVYGRCEVALESNQEQDGSWNIKKSKDLNKCKFRRGYDFAIKTGSHLSGNSAQANPFVQATLRSMIKVEGGSVKMVDIKEEYNFQPMGNFGESLTSVVVITKITQYARNKDVFTLDSSHLMPSSLLYETEKINRGEVTVPTLIKAIHDASEEEDAGVVPLNGAEEFNKLVSVLQQANKAELLTTYAQVKSGAGVKYKNTAMSVFWDGLISASSAASTETAAILMMNKEMPKNKISDFLASLSFVKHPTEETLIALSPLLDGTQVPHDRYLAIGALIQSFILDYSNTNSLELSNLLEKLASPLNKGCICKSIEEEDSIISSLKAIRNAKYATAEIWSLVKSCATNNNVTNRIRVAALQTMMINSSEETIKKDALSLFRNIQMDTEIRIAAFQVYVNSPDAETAENVKNLLDIERSDHVGNYMVSYFRNLRTSMDSQKESLKQYYGNIKTKKKFQTDFLQYSQNYHFSQLFSSLNSGYAVNADVIFSPQSYLPRSTSLNLNTCLFGNTFNLFELETRFENVEYLLEKYGGPRSYVRSNLAENIADDFAEVIQNLASEATKKATSLGRNKRNTEHAENMLPKKSKKRSPLSEKYLDIDFSAKMFESEVLWSAYHADRNNIMNGEYLDSLFRHFEQAIEDAKNIDIDYKKYSRFPILSNNLIHYPTSSGFSFKLSTNVNSVVNFKMNGTVDAMKMMKNPKSTDVRLLIMPSASVEVEGLLEIDASVISVGLKASSSIHTATGLEVIFNVLNGESYDFKLGIPVKNQDIFTMKTEAFSTMQERGLPPVATELKPSGKRYEKSNTFDQLSQLTGLSLHTKFDTAAFNYKPYFSPSIFSIHLVKDDENWQYYNMKAQFSKDANHRSMELLFDTPHSIIDRKMLLYFEANSLDKKLVAKFNTPRKKLSIEASGIARNNEISVDVKFMNDVAEYYMKLGATVANEELRTIYKPFVQFKSPHDLREESLDKIRMVPKQAKQLLDIDGLIILDRKKNIPTSRKYEFEELTIISPLGKLSVNGPVQVDSQFPQFSSHLILTYGDTKNTLTLQSNLNYTKQTTEEKHIIADLAVIPSQWPTYSFKYTLNFDETSNTFERTQTFTHGPDLNSSISKLIVKEILNTEKNSNNKIISGNGNLDASYPLWKFDMNTGFKEQNNNFYSGYCTLVLDQTNIALNGSLGLSNRKQGNIDIQLQSKMNEKNLDLSAVRELVNDEKSKIKIDVNTNPGKQISISINLTHKLIPENYVFKANSVITVLPDKKTYKQNIGVLYTLNEKAVYLSFYPNNQKNLEIKAGYTMDQSTLDANVSLFIINVIDGDASFELKTSKMNGQMNVNILKLNRLIKGKLDLSINDNNNYIGFGELLWDASNDVSKKFRLNTNTTILNKNRHITTANKVEIIDYEFQMNGIYTLNGELDNGDMTTKVDFIMSDGSSFGVDLSRSRHVDNAVISHDIGVSGFYSQTKKEEPIRFSYKLNGRDLDFTNNMFDMKTEMTLDKSKMNYLKIALGGQRILSDGKWTTGANIHVDGTIVKKKINLLLASEYSDQVHDYGLLNKERNLLPTSIHLSANIGDDYVVDNRGKIANAEINNVLSLKIPLQQEQFLIKWTTNSKIDIDPSKHISIGTINNVVYNENKFINWNGKFETYPKNGKLSMDWESSDVTRRLIDLAYSYDTTQDEGLLGPYAQATVNFTFNGKKANCLVKLEFSKDLSTRLVTISGFVPITGKFDIQGINKVEDFGQSIYNEVSLINEKNRWSGKSLINTYPTKPEINLSYVSPEGESKFVVKFEEHVQNYWSGFTAISWMHGSQGYLNADGELKLATADDILVKVQLDSPTFGVNNFSFTATNKVTDGSKKKISFDVKIAEILYTGSGTYIYHLDNQKLVFEGTGFIKIDNKHYPIMLKYNRLQLTEVTNGETGSANKIFLSVDKKYILDLEGKYTDKSLLLKGDLWREEKCYKLDLTHQIKMIDVLNYEKNFLVRVNLSPSVPNGEEFIIKGKTIRSPSNYNHDLSLQWAQDKKVEYNLYSADGKLGFILTLPQRQIAAEALYSYKLETTDGNMKVTGTIWFDKKQDQNQTLLLSISEEYKIPEDKSNFVVRSTASLQIPTLPRKFTINTGFLFSPYNDKIILLKNELDIFKTPEQMITVTYQLKKEKKNIGYMFSDVLKIVSEGQKLSTELQKSALITLDHAEYHFGVSYIDYQGRKKNSTLDLDFRFTSITAKVEVFENITLKGKVSISIGKNYIEIKEEFDVFGHEYAKICRLTSDPNLIVLVEWRGKVKQTLEINTTFVFSQFLKVLVMVDSGKVASVTLLLDENNFMKSETEIVIDNAEILLDKGKKDLLSLIEDVKSNSKLALSEISAQIAYRGKQYREASVNMKPIIESSNAYLMALRDEIKNDPSIISASQNVKQVINSATHFVIVILQQISKFLGEWMYGYNLLLEKLSDFTEGLIPKINNLLQISIDDITQSLREYVNQLGKLAINLLQYIKANQQKWKDAFRSIYNSIKDSVKIAHDTIEEIKTNIKESCEKIRSYLHSLPITNYLKDKISQLKNSQIAQYIWSAIIEIVEKIKETMPTTEMKVLVELIMSTLDKIVNEKPYDMNEELIKIYKQIVESIRSLVRLIADNPNFIKDLTNNDYDLSQLTLTSIKNIPNVYYTTISIVNWMREVDVPSVDEIVDTFTVGRFDLPNLIPPYRKVGVIVDGQHIITMNGNHYGINGECQYLLSADLDNFNFTVTGDIRNNKLLSLAVSSSAQTIELYYDKMPTLDKVSTDFPVYGDGLYAVRNLYSIDIYVDDSVFITCSFNLDVCLLRVSGFYYSKVYGLLGSMTAESFMDFTMPDMNIADDIPSFIKSYQIGTKCKESTLISQNEIERSAECNGIFKGKSILNHGISLLKTKPYRDMCDQAVSLKSTTPEKLDAACKTAIAFSLASNADGYFFSLPSQCSKCIINGKLLPYGSTNQVIAPSKTADILLIVDESQHNEPVYNELFIESLSSIKSLLMKNGISDVHFILIVYGSENKPPSLRTTNGNILLNENTKVQFSNIARSEPISNLGKCVKNIKYLLGMYNAHQALEMASSYPFRSDSVKAIIQIDARTEDSMFLDEYNIYNTLINTFSSWDIVNNKIPMFLVTSKESIISDLENDSSNLFGFDLSTVYKADGSKSTESDIFNKMHLFISYKGEIVLPLSTNGAIFNSSQFIHSQPTVRNKLMDVFSNRIVDGLISYERVSECTCKYKWGMYSELSCSLISTSKRY